MLATPRTRYQLELLLKMPLLTLERGIGQRHWRRCSSGAGFRSRALPICPFNYFNVLNDRCEMNRQRARTIPAGHFY